MESSLPILMAVLTLVFILLGYRVAFVLGGSAAVFILISDLPPAFFNLIVSRIYANVLSNWLLVAIPMFIFMGLVLEKSGVAERALRSAQAAFGGSPAGMGISVLIIGTLLAASSGIVGASVVLLTMLALPRMLEAGFDKKTSSGLIASSGTLAILIPPSVMLIVLGDQLQAPIPDLFAGAIGPGLLLIALYGGFIIYKSIGVELTLDFEKPNIGRLFLDIGPLIILVLCVLGSIVVGIATPTEASGLGAFGAIVITILYKRFDRSIILAAASDTVVTTSMVMMVMIGATCFSAVFRGIGGDELVRDAMLALGGDAWTVLIIIMITVFLLGFVLDWLEITLILMPIIIPLLTALDFGNGLDSDTLLVWFGILFAVNLQTSFLTPPFGFSLFYLKGAAENQLVTSDIYRGVAPYIALQILALGLLIVFPGIVTGFIKE